MIFKFMQANRHHLTTIVVTIVTLVPYFIVIVQLVEPYFFLYRGFFHTCILLVRNRIQFYSVSSSPVFPYVVMTPE